MCVSVESVWNQLVSLKASLVDCEPTYHRGTRVVRLKAEGDGAAVFAVRRAVGDPDGCTHGGAINVDLRAKRRAVANGTVATQQPLEGLLVAVSAEQRELRERAVINGVRPLLDPRPVEANRPGTRSAGDNRLTVASERLVARKHFHREDLPTAGCCPAADVVFVDVTVAVVVHSVADFGRGGACGTPAVESFVHVPVAVVVAAVADLLRRGAARSSARNERRRAVAASDEGSPIHLFDRASGAVQSVRAIRAVAPVGAVGDERCRSVGAGDLRPAGNVFDRAGTAGVVGSARAVRRRDEAVAGDGFVPCPEDDRVP